MTQFTVDANRNAKTKKTFPYLLDIQSELWDGLQTTAVISHLLICTILLFNRSLGASITKAQNTFTVIKVALSISTARRCCSAWVS